MAFRYGFKTYANSLAEDIRRELGLGVLDAFDPRRLAAYLDIPIWNLSDFVDANAILACLVSNERKAFSAATIFRGPKRTIVHNDSHRLGRQNSNLVHELAHSLLLHPPAPALDDRGCRDWNKDIEDEADWLAGILLISEPATLEIAKGRWTKDEAAEQFSCTKQMVQRRINATGAVARVQRLWNYRSP